MVAGYRYGFTVLMLFFHTLLYAQEDSIDTALLHSLQEVSDIAWATHVNVDETPSFVSVVQGAQAQELGASTLLELLTMVMGSEQSIEMNGANELILRGIKGKGKIKLLIDGVAINNSFRGSMYHYYDMPIELIERVEVLRGSDASRYGSNAIAGVIRVITKASLKNSQNLLYGRALLNSNRGGFITGIKHGDIQANISGFYSQGNLALPTSSDKNGTVGTSNENLSYVGLGAHVWLGDVHINFDLQNHTKGAAYGLAGYLEPKKDLPGVSNTNGYMGVRYSTQLNSDTTLHSSASAMYYAQNIHTYYREGIIYQSGYSEGNLRANVELKNRSFKNHALVMGAKLYAATMRDSSFSSYYENNNSTLNSATKLFDKDVRRLISSVYASDAIEFNHGNIDIGVRLEHYSDFGWTLSPKVGGVLFVTPYFSVKALYSKAYRAPSWVEMYASVPNVSVGNSALLPESVDHVEIGAVYKPTTSMVFRLNSYAMRIEDIIYRNSSAVYSQEGKNYFLGVESQYEYTHSSALHLGANLNYARAVDSSWQALESVAHYNAALYINYALLPNIKLNSFLKRVSSRSRAPQDSRLEVPGYTALDISAVYKYKTIDIALYIKNILDEDIYYVSPPNTYSSDFLRQKRNYTVSVSWKY